MAVTKLFALLFLSLCPISVTAECLAGELPIRKKLVHSAWQSSNHTASSCFNNRNEGEERNVLDNRTTYSYLFYHSESNKTAVDGFHWFAVQLKDPVLITSATVKGREDGANETFSRAAEIEIWTSSLDGSIFSASDQCNAKEMGSQFNESLAHRWIKCGTTASLSASNIKPGHNFTVNCTKVSCVRHLVLRRNITGKSNPNDDYMSFADLRLQTVQLKSSGPQVVAQGSKFPMSCSLHCNGTELSTDSTSLQLCLPNGTCTGQHKMEIVSAKPGDSGNYKCKVDSAEHSTTVTMLKSTAPEFVSQNSSFTVNCSLYCNGTELRNDSTLSANLTLCYPNDTCTRNDNIRIDEAQPHHSGVYKCRVNSVEHQTNVTVLYPPSKVSVSLINGDNCKDTSEVKVQFQSTHSVPAAEHKCSAENWNRTEILNLTLESFISSSDGAVTRWSFGVNGSHLTQGWSNGSIECIAVQTLPDGIGFQNEHRAWAAWSCSNATLNFALIAGGVSAILVSLIFCLIYNAHQTVTQRRCHAAAQSPICHELSHIPETSLLQSDGVTECAYLTVISKAADLSEATAAGDTISQRDTISCCTQYLDIVADGAANDAE